MEEFMKGYLKNPSEFLARDDNLANKAEIFLNDHQKRHCLDLGISIGRDKASTFNDKESFEKLSAVIHSIGVAT